MAPERRDGDWDCPDCGALNFARNETCFKCDKISQNGGGGGGAREGDWTCPDCGALVFASKDSCFKCDKKAGDWNCPNCGVKVFASKSACFQCGTARPKAGAKGKGNSKASSKGSTAPSGGGSAVGQSDPIKALAKISPSFKKAWVTYCRSAGQGFSDPGRCSKEFITEFADHVASLIEANLQEAEAAADPDGWNEAEEEAPQEQPAAAPAPAQKRVAEAPAPAQAPAKKKLTMKKAVADEIARLNGLGTLQAKIGLAAVARPLSELGEEKALVVLNLLEENQEEVEDPNAWICEQAQLMAEEGDE